MFTSAIFRKCTVFSLFLTLASCQWLLDEKKKNDDIPETCGDNEIQSPEQCDGSNLQDQTCSTLGLGNGVLSCAKNCSYDTSGCSLNASCGDSQIQGNEECDGENMNGATCTSLGKYSGVLSCTNTCLFDISGCGGSCGDGILQPSFEECDTLDFGSASCIQTGKFFGQLQCDSLCKINDSHCNQAIQFGTDQDDSPGAIAVDAAGNLFVTGPTYGSFETFTNPGGADIIVSKFGSHGIHLWTLQFGSDSYDIPEDIAIDSLGNIFVTGYTQGSLNNQTLVGSTDIFLVKLDNDGNTLWTRQWGTSNNDMGNALVLDHDNNIYVTGSIGDTFDGQAYIGLDDAFVTKLDSSGNILWTRIWGSTKTDVPEGISMDGSGNLYVSGTTWGALDGQTQVGERDAFLTKWNTQGTKLWSRQWGSTLDDASYATAVSGSGESFVIGSTQGVLDGQHYGGDWDIFLTKYSSDGNKQWTRQWGTSGLDFGANLILYNNNIYLMGSTNAVFPGENSSGERDIFVSNFNLNGEHQWTKQLGTTGSDNPGDFSHDGNGNLFIMGSTNGFWPNQSNFGKTDFFIYHFVIP